LIEERFGLHFPADRLLNLERSLRSAVTDFGFHRLPDFCRWLLSTPLSRPQMEKLASHLTISETYFFRDRRLFTALETKILPALIQERRNSTRQLRIWSAACASGEEPYSLALLLRSLVPDLDNWRVHLWATDINPRVLEKARAAVYGNWSFRSTPDSLRELQFDRLPDGRFRLRPEITRLPRFEYFNLVEDDPTQIWEAQHMDLILCRNVLMYFSLPVVERVVRRLHECLTPGGWLAVSPAELSQQVFRHFEAVEMDGAALVCPEPE